MRKVRGAQITVRCDCGGIGYVPYGERWECPTCHRRWNTGQIPAEECWGMMRDMRRVRSTVIVTALAIVIPILALSAIAGIRILLLLPIVMSFWLLFYMPRWRRRVRQQARRLRRWKLHPDRGAAENAGTDGAARSAPVPPGPSPASHARDARCSLRHPCGGLRGRLGGRAR